MRPVESSPELKKRMKEHEDQADALIQQSTDYLQQRNEMEETRRQKNAEFYNQVHNLSYGDF